MKILLGMSPVGGHLAGIQYGLKQIGVESDLVYYANNKYNMPSDYIVWKSGMSKLERKFAIYDFFKFANEYYDVIHFVFGSSFITLPNQITFLDLPFISKDIKIFTTFNGCDIRQKSKASLIDKNCACADPTCGVSTCGYISDKMKHFKSIIFNKYSNKTYVTTPDLKDFSPNSTLLFQPKHTFNDYDFIEMKQTSKKLKVLHAPSDPIIKGTKEIIIACEKLKDHIDLILVQNLSNEEAMQLYREADIIIDQLKIGWYGGFAVEAMRMGKPIIAYISDSSLKYIDDELKNDLPIINSNINNIYNTLKELIYNRELLPIYSLKSYNYVNRYHDPRIIAKTLYQDYLS